MNKGVLTAIKYKDEIVDESLEEGDPQKRRPTIFVWARKPDKSRERLEIKGFRPYFFVPTWIKSEANYILQMPEIEEIEEVQFGKAKLFKLFTYIPGHVTKVKRIIQEAFAQAAVKEGDVLFELRYLIDKELRGEIDWTIDSNNPVPINEDMIIPLRRVYIDIEMWTARLVKEGRLWTKEYIKCLTAYDNYEKVYHTWYFNQKDLHLKGDDSWKILWCPSIEEMLKGFLVFIKETDPDVITGYNIDFDLLAIRQEALRRGMGREFDYLSALHDLGYSVGRPVLKKHRIRGVDWSRKGLLLDGREVVDILDLIRMISRSQLREYSLDFVSKKFLGEKEGKIRYKDEAIGPNLAKIWVVAPQVVLEYNKRDVELIVKLDEHNNLIDSLDTMRKTVGVRLCDAFSNQRMIDAEALRRRTYPLPSKFSNKKNEKDTYKGALVVTPVLGLHKWIICLDWKSLYPCIVRTFNIDTDTYVSDPRLLPPGREVYKFSNEDGSKTWMFVKKPRGLFPQMLDDFVNLRDTIRLKLEKETDPEKKRLLDIRQESIKVLSNAIYGSFGFRSRKHSFECAEAITTFGQKMIKLAADVAVKMGFTVIYGDTDSIFVMPGTSSYGETYNEGVRLQDSIMAHIPNFTSGFKVDEKNLFSINLEKIYDAFFMSVKKRYCGRIITKEGKVEKDVKGLDTKRSDTSDFAAELQDRLIDTLLQGRKRGELAQQIADDLNKIATLPLTKISVPSAISKPLKIYKNNPIQKRAALNSNTYLDTHFDFGSKPLRIYIIPPPRELVHTRSGKKTEAEKKEQEMEIKKLNVIAFDSTTVLPDWVKIDYPKVVKLTVKPKIDKFLESLQIPWEDVETLLLPEYRSIKKEKKLEKPGTTLDSFLGGKKDD
jgi:DNA polymerase elongation subunit (family B)